MNLPQLNDKNVPTSDRDIAAEGWAIASLVQERLENYRLKQISQEEWHITLDGDRVGGFCFDECWFRTETTPPVNHLVRSYVRVAVSNAIAQWADEQGGVK